MSVRVRQTVGIPIDKVDIDVLNLFFCGGEPDV